MTRANKNPVVLLLLLAGSGIGCERDTQSTSGPIPEERLTDLYAHVLILEAEGKLAGIDSVDIELRTDSLYAARNITRNDAESALNQYRRDLPEWRRFHGLVIERLEAIRQSERTAK